MDRVKTAFELSSDSRAVSLFRGNEDGALAGNQLLSPETDAEARDRWAASPNRKKSKMMFDYIQSDLMGFMERAAQLPHVLQDVLYQYYLLGRKQAQIGSTLNMSQTAVWQALSSGIDGVCALIQGRPIPAEVLFFNEIHLDLLEVQEPDSLGAFEQKISDPDVELNFAPTTTDGAVRC